VWLGREWADEVEVREAAAAGDELSVQDVLLCLVAVSDRLDPAWLPAYARTAARNAVLNHRRNAATGPGSWRELQRPTTRCG
jgi:hypothetical protein